MQPDSTDSMLLRRFESPATVRDAHNALVDYVQAGTLADSPDLLISRTPMGTTATPLGSDGTSSSPIFRATVKRYQSGALIAFERGLVGGVEPKIGEFRISQLTPRGNRPALIVEPSAFDADGVARIYVQLDFARDWSISAAKIVASATLRGTSPWRAHDLLGLIERAASGSPRYVRFAFMNHGHVAVQRSEGGIARHLFFAQ